ncbi:MAG: hypothetical protein ABEJ59_02240 [Halanaeroarchaeum sp.]
MTQTYSRRSVLADLGAVGTAAVASRSLRQREPPYTHYTYAKTDGGRLSVAWYETYNGSFQEAQNGSTETNATLVTDPTRAPLYVPEATGPVVTLGNVLPGDSGAVLFGLLAESFPTAEEGMTVWFQPTIASNSEGTITEPERADGDGPTPGGAATGGEPADALRVQLFGDDGFLGGCDGQFWLTDTPLTGVGSMPAVFDSLSGGIDLTADRCLQEGERRCFGFTWELPADVGNVVQTDGVVFDLSFVGLGCGADSPFSEGAV